MLRIEQVCRLSADCPEDDALNLGSQSVRLSSECRQSSHHPDVHACLADDSFQVLEAKRKQIVRTLNN